MDQRRRSHQQLILLVAAVAGGLLAAEPTGVAAADVVWSGGFVLGLAYVGGYAPRWVALTAAGCVSLVADTRLSLGLAIAAVALAAYNARQGRRSLRWGTLGSALVALSLLTGSGPEDRVLAAITTTTISVLLAVGGATGMRPRQRRRLLRRGAMGLGVVGLFALAGGLAALLARSNVDRGIDDFRAAQAVATNGDLAAAVQEFRSAEETFGAADRPLSTFGRMGRLVPGLSQQLAATDTAVEAAGDAAESAAAAGARIDLDAVGVNAGRVDLGALRRTEAPVEELVATLVRTVDRLAGIDRRLLVGPVSDALEDALTEARRAGGTADRFHRSIQVAPELLGAERPTRFLVLFTSPVEARNRFGFPGSFAVLRLDGGRISFERAGPIAELDPPEPFDQLALRVPPRAQPYLGYGVSRQWRSVTIPPHGPAAAGMARQLAAQGGIGEVDGVVFAAPEALAALVGLTGDIPLPSVGQSLSQATTVEFLTRTQYLEFPELGRQAERKDLLVDAAEALGQRLTTLSLPSAQALLDLFGPIVERGYLAISVPEDVAPAAAHLLADAGVDGGFPLPGHRDADVVFVGQRNSIGNKIDLFLSRSLSYESVVDVNGGLRADLTIQLTNGAPSTGLPPYLIGASISPPPPSGTNLSTTLIYSRHQLTELTVDGVATVPPVLVEGGFYVYQVQVDMAPGQVRTVHAAFEGAALDANRHEVVLYPGGLLTPDKTVIRVADERFDTAARRSATIIGPICVSVRLHGKAC